MASAAAILWTDDSETRRGPHHQAQVYLPGEREADREHSGSDSPDRGKDKVQERCQNGIARDKSEGHPRVPAESLEQRHGADERKLDGKPLSDEGERRYRNENPHEGSWIEVEYASGTGLSQDGALGKKSLFVGKHPLSHYTRPAFSKCFLNIPFAM